jgi:alpha-ribazole phosphatase
MVSRIVLLRHGKTDLSGRFAGSTDVSLSPVGVDQILALRSMLAAEKFERIFCSPMRRCRETAQLLDLDGDISYLDSLREIDFGAWEAKDFAEIEASDPERVRDWLDDPEGFCFPEGECCTDFIRRLEGFHNFLQDIDDKNVLIIAHGGVIRHLLCIILGISCNNYLLFQIDEGKLTTLDCFREGGVLTGLNRGGQRPWES